MRWRLNASEREKAARNACDPVWSALPNDRALRAAHAPFTRAMAKATPGSSNYLRHAAMLIALQFLDGRIPFAWLSHGKRALEDLKPIRVRKALENIIGSIDQTSRPTPATLQAFDHYASMLQREGRFDMAAHLYERITEWLPRFGDTKHLARIHVHLARCLRKRGNREAAWAVCQAGLLAAQIHGNQTERIELFLQQAPLCIPQRRFPEAARLLSEALHEADTLDNAQLAARARHDWGAMITEECLTSGDATQLIGALRLLAHAWQSVGESGDPEWRLRILNDIGRVFAVIYPAVAEIAYRAVYTRARDADSRWRAGINLTDLMISIQDREGYDAIRRDMDREHLPPPLQAVYSALIAEGSLAFDRPGEFTPARKRAVKIAKRLRDVSVLEDIAALDHWSPPPRPAPPQDLSPEIREIALRVVFAKPPMERLRRGRRPYWYRG